VKVVELEEEQYTHTNEKLKETEESKEGIP